MRAMPLISIGTDARGLPCRSTASACTALADRYPAACLDAGHHRGRPQDRVAANRLHFAVRVGERRFERDALRCVDVGQALQRDRRAVAVERQRQLVGDQLRRVGIVVRRRCVVAVLRIVVGIAVARFRAIRREAEILEAVRERRRRPLHQRRYLHRQVRCAAARSRSAPRAALPSRRRAASARRARRSAFSTGRRNASTRKLPL